MAKRCFHRLRFFFSFDFVVVSSHSRQPEIVQFLLNIFGTILTTPDTNWNRAWRTICASVPLNILFARWISFLACPCLHCAWIFCFFLISWTSTSNVEQESIKHQHISHYSLLRIPQSFDRRWDSFSLFLRLFIQFAGKFRWFVDLRDFLSH